MREKDTVSLLLHFSFFAPLYYVFNVAVFDSPIHESVREAMIVGVFYAVGMSLVQSYMGGHGGR